MDDQVPTHKPKPLIWILIFLAATSFIAALVVRRWRRRRVTRPPPRPVVPLPVEGLTEAEAEARRLEGQDNVIQFRPPRDRGEIWRENVYTIFNLSLLGLAFAQLLLGRPLDALLSIGTMLLNIGLNIGQELWARRRLREVEQAARPQATVIRAAMARSIDPSEIVLGDALVVGPGDQLLVDGEVVGDEQIFVDESMLTGKSVRVAKGAGDQVYAGSFCLAGRGAYIARRVGNERLIATQVVAAPSAKEELTSLERIIDRILRILLLVVAILTIMLLSAYFRLDLGIPADLLNDAVSVIFGIAPASLFFMIILTYANGTADLAKYGALVHRARSVEILAQSTVVCFAKAGILTGTHVEIDPVEPSQDRERLAESRIRQILGDYARSTSADNLAMRAMVSAFEGSPRVVAEEAPFLSLYGWEAISFDDDDLRGVYVLGDPEILEPYLAGDGAEPGEADQDSSLLPDLRNVFAPLGRLFRRSEGTQPEAEAETEGLEQLEEEPDDGPQETWDVDAAVIEEDNKPETTGAKSDDEPQGAQDMDSEVLEEDGEASTEGASPGNFFRRLGKRIGRVLRREKTVQEEEEIPEEAPVQEVILLFAYYPELTPLHVESRMPQLPQEMIPICKLRYTERVRPEAIDTIKIFSETGVGIKVFTADAPEQTAVVLKQAGMSEREGSPLLTISGSELAGMNAEQLRRAAAENTVFGQITPEQARLVVGALREAGESVAVVGDGVNDLPAMRQANLAVSRQSSTQAALSAADIILLSDSPDVLSHVLDKGQRIVNGLLDVLKLQLTQVFYLALLILSIGLISFGFPYASAQGTIITIATIAIPSVGLSLWAVAGVLPTARLTRILVHFVVPAAITMSAAALVVYLFFLDRTQDVKYTQLVVTWTLLAAGLVLVVFVKPPWRVFWRGSVRRGDPRPAVLVLILLALLFVVAAIPLAQQLLKFGWLREPSDYLYVGLVVLGWAFSLRLIWLAIPLVRKP